MVLFELWCPGDAHLVRQQTFVRVVVVYRNGLAWGKLLCSRYEPDAAGLRISRGGLRPLVPSSGFVLVCDFMSSRQVGFSSMPLAHVEFMIVLPCAWI